MSKTLLVAVAAALLSFGALAQDACKSRGDFDAQYDYRFTDEMKTAFD